MIGSCTVESVVTFRGILGLVNDFASGYAHDMIVEDAEVIGAVVARVAPRTLSGARTDR